jgi:hypothetical protein
MIKKFYDYTKKSFAVEIFIELKKTNFAVSKNSFAQSFFTLHV